MITASHFLASRHTISAKGIEKATNGGISARTVRKARQGREAALNRVQLYLDEKGEPKFKEDTTEPLST